MKGKRAQGTIFGLLFIILSIVVYTAEISGSMISFIMGLLACVAVILMVADFEEMFSRGILYKEYLHRHGRYLRLRNMAKRIPRNFMEIHSHLLIC